MVFGLDEKAILTTASARLANCSSSMAGKEIFGIGCGGAGKGAFRQLWIAER